MSAKLTPRQLNAMTVDRSRLPQEVEVILASVCEKTRQTIWTFRLRYWRAIHAEFMTHRAFSRNAGSSRAIPVKKVLAQVWNNPAGPQHWGVNQPGMQARAEMVGWRRALAGGIWRFAGKVACGFAWGLMKLGTHKQVANRLLEPWQYINVVVTATDWDNFFKLRCHPDAQPEFQALANEIHWVYENYPTFVDLQELKLGDWHLPYILASEEELPLDDRLKLSTARCARVSYEPFDGDASHEKEFKRHDDLVGAEPIHASPTEHQALCMGREERTANFAGFIQYRWFIENGVKARALSALASHVPTLAD